jgi:hypothetical protein
MSDEKITTTKVEVQRLLDACFIREVQYPTWLANLVMVKKKNGNWRMCTYFYRFEEVLLEGRFLALEN